MFRADKIADLFQLQRSKAQDTRQNAALSLLQAEKASHRHNWRTPIYILRPTDARKAALGGEILDFRISNTFHNVKCAFLFRVGKRLLLRVFVEKLSGLMSLQDPDVSHSRPQTEALTVNAVRVQARQCERHWLRSPSRNPRLCADYFLNKSPTSHTHQEHRKMHSRNSDIESLRPARSA